MSGKSRRKWPVILGIAFIAIVIGVMAYSTFGNAQQRCEVCVTFNGRTVCKNGAATTREQAERVALESACTDLSSGMTSLMQCQSGAPTKVTWKQ